MGTKSKTISELTEGEYDDPTPEEESSLAVVKYKESIRNVQTPGEQISVAQSEEWSKVRLAQLAPAAIAELERQLKFSGVDKQRLDAAREILDRAGMSKNDMAVQAKQSAAPIIVLIGKGAIVPPWSQKSDKKVVEGEIVKPKKTKK